MTSWPPLLAAPFIGSFCGVLITRVPAGRPFAAVRSACENCGHHLAPHELVPLLSYAIQRGKCRACGAHISAFHPLIEIAATALAACAVAVAPDSQTAWAGCVLGWVLLALGGIDARCLRLPDFLTLPLILTGLADALWQDQTNLTNRAPNRALAAALAYTLLFVLAATYKKWRGRDGLGLGDAKLLAAGGAWLGLAPLPYALLCGCGLALLYAALRAWRGGGITATTRIPLGPFLGAGIFAVWLACTYFA